MPQIVPWTTVAIAQSVHHPMDRVDADRDAALPLQQRLQIANTPDGNRQAIGLRPLLQRFLQKRTGSLIQRRRTATAGPIQQALTPFGREARLPDADAVGGGAHE